MIVAVVAYVEPPLRVCFVVPDLDFVETSIVVDKRKWLFAFLFGKLASISSFLAVLRANYLLNLTLFMLAMAKHCGKSLGTRPVLQPKDCSLFIGKDLAMLWGLLVGRGKGSKSTSLLVCNSRGILKATHDEQIEMEGDLIGLEQSAKAWEESRHLRVAVAGSRRS